VDLEELVSFTLLPDQGAQAVVDHLRIALAH